jgi:hypothetical protein
MTPSTHFTAEGAEDSQRTRRNMAYNDAQMSRPLESFEFLNRGWDIRILEQMSLRSLFVILLIDVFMLGMLGSVVIYGLVRFNRFEWSNVIVLLFFVLSVCRYSPIIYRRLER